MVRKKLITELEAHKDEYLEVFGGEHHYNYILNGLHPPADINAFAPPEKWLTFSDMGHIVATAFNMVVVELTRVSDFKSETFFPIRGEPTSNPDDSMIVLGLIPNHFVHIFLKKGCPIPPTCNEWRLFERTEACQRWEDSFLDRQVAFT